MSAPQAYVEIPKRPVYVGGTGPVMEPPTLLPSGEGDRGWKIVGMVELNNVSQYVISPKLNPVHRRAIKQEHIRNWISQRDVEAFDFAQTYSDADLNWDAEIQNSQRSKNTTRKELAKKVQGNGEDPVVLTRRDRNLAYRNREGIRKEDITSRTDSTVNLKSVPNSPLKRKLSTSASNFSLKRKHSALLGEFFSNRNKQILQPSLSSPPQQLIGMDEEDDNLEVHETASTQNLSYPSTTSRYRKENARLEASMSSESKSPASLLWEPAQKSIQDNRVTRSRSTSVSILPRSTLAGSQMSVRSPTSLQAKNQGVRVAHESSVLKKSPRVAERRGSATSTASSATSKKQKHRTMRNRLAKVNDKNAAKDEDDEWEVRAILNEEVRQEKGKKVTYYQVDWEGDWSPTWEPASNVSADTIDEYHKRINSKLTRERRTMLGVEDHILADSGNKTRIIASTAPNLATVGVADDIGQEQGDGLVRDDVTHRVGRARDLPLVPESITISRRSSNQDAINQPPTPISISTDREPSMTSDFAKFTNFLDGED